MAPPAERPAVSLSLESLADVLGFEVPPSHRARWGGAVTRLKRLAMAGLGPVQRVLLERQARFDAVLAALLRHPGPSLPSRVRAELAPLVTPEEGARRWLREPWGRAQRAWNLAVVELLSGPSWPLRTDGVRARLDALEARCDVLAEARLPRALMPVLREVLRRQVAFNHACVRVLRHVLGAARPVMVLPMPEDHARECHAQEARDIPSAAAAVERLEHRPLFSLVTPAWETPPAVLRACIESVQAQVYPHWELCIVDDGSRSAEVEATVRPLAERDSRIRFMRLQANQGIARATNAALEMATGDFIGFLDHDDLLAPHALAEVALRLAAEPETDVLYSDEDKVDGEGRRFAPYLKPELSPELLRAVNYVCHFLVVRATVLRDVGGIRPGFEGAQDHDLLLRLLERTRRFAHIPKVLYHWRTLPGSTATDASAKPAASEAGRRAVAEHLARLGEPGEVETSAPGLYRIRRPLPRRPSVSVLLSRDDASTLKALLDTAGDVDLEVLLPVTSGCPGHSDGSSPGRMDARLPAVLGGTGPEGASHIGRVQEPLPTTPSGAGPVAASRAGLVEKPLSTTPIGAGPEGKPDLRRVEEPLPTTPSGAGPMDDPRLRRVEVPSELSPGVVAHRLLREARGELVLWLAPDTAPTEQGWLGELASQALRADVGVVGARVVSEAGTVLHAGLGVDAEGRARRLFAGLPDPSLSAFGGSHWPRDVLAVSGACAMSRREVLERLRGLDERFISAEACVVDLCLRSMGAGLRVLYTPHARLVRTGAAPEEEWGAEDAARLRASCLPLLRAGRGDPYSHSRLGV